MAHGGHDLFTKAVLVFKRIYTMLDSILCNLGIPADDALLLDMKAAMGQRMQADLLKHIEDTPMDPPVFNICGFGSESTTVANCLVGYPVFPILEAKMGQAAPISAVCEEDVKEAEFMSPNKQHPIAESPERIQETMRLYQHTLTTVSAEGLLGAYVKLPMFRESYLPSGARGVTLTNWPSLSCLGTLYSALMVAITRPASAFVCVFSLKHDDSAERRARLQSLIQQNEKGVNILVVIPLSPKQDPEDFMPSMRKHFSTAQICIVPDPEESLYTIAGINHVQLTKQVPEPNEFWAPIFNSLYGRESSTVPSPEAFVSHCKQSRGFATGKAISEIVLPYEQMTKRSEQQYEERSDKRTKRVTACLRNIFDIMSVSGRYSTTKFCGLVQAVNEALNFIDTDAELDLNLPAPPPPETDAIFADVTIQQYISELSRAVEVTAYTAGTAVRLSARIAELFRNEYQKSVESHYESIRPAIRTKIGDFKSDQRSQVPKECSKWITETPTFAFAPSDMTSTNLRFYLSSKYRRPLRVIEADILETITETAKRREVLSTTVLEKALRDMWLDCSESIKLDVREQVRRACQEYAYSVRNDLDWILSAMNRVHVVGTERSQRLDLEALFGKK